LDTTNFPDSTRLNPDRIRIGTRESPLALWQAEQVAERLKERNTPCTLVPIRSQGDLNLETPLYEMGITGIFTRSLDIALLNGEVDIAVHSMKDVPTQLPTGLASFAVLKREDSGDLAVLKSDDPLPDDAVVATGSLRRKAQWLKRYPGHQVVDLRDNVQTRLAKLESQPWHAALFARAGLERMGITPQYCRPLDWMMPAPAQGAILVVGREEDYSKYQSVFNEIDHAETRSCVELERAFLRELEGGCTAPIGALAQIEAGELEFRGGLYSVDGSRSVEVYRKVNTDEAQPELAQEWARSLLDQGGDRIMQFL